MTTTEDVPGQFAIAINGTPFAVDLDKYERMTLDTIRQQADTSPQPGEQSLNPHDLWRRSTDDWVLGAGQEWFDRADSSRLRFRSSRGVDPWERGELSLLPDTERIDGFTGTIGKAINVGPRVYVIRGTTLAYWDGATWTTTGVFPQTVRDITTDGYNIYCAVRDDAAANGGVYIVTLDTNAPTKINNLIPDRVAFVKGRLMVAANPDIYNITDLADPSPPDPLSASVNDQWQWDCFGEGTNDIFVAGHSNDVTLIYRVGIRSDGTRLTAASEAAQLPDGETVNVITRYLGVVMLGTSKGFRVALEQGGGLRPDSVIEVGPVRDFEPQGQFVWFTWDNPETGWTGLGRADLKRFSQQGKLIPAYATDLLVATTNEVRSVVTFQGRRHFVLTDAGVYREHATRLVASGVIRTGKIVYGLADKKAFQSLEIRHKPLPAGASVAVEGFLDDDDVTPVLAETSDVDGGTDARWEMAGATGEYIEYELTMNRATDDTDGPTLTRWLARALAIPTRTKAFLVPLDLRKSVENLRSEKRNRKPQEELAALEALELAGAPVDYQEFDQTFQVVIDRIKMGPDLQLASDGKWFEGPVWLTLRRFDMPS